ncbi:MarR family winged helix-turn-helix transcriptional regulator [Nocardioides sp.]|uniref:MarR family winged helix-turn-helix transcriptional regulator n=1 Tax=Nocardioides sp. TaxID=35761 RepID=UPI0035114097
MTPDRADSLVALEHQIGVLIRRVRRVIAVRAGAVHPDLQSASYLMLVTLKEQGPLRASALAELYDIDKGAISRQVTHLLELGLITKTPDPQDARASLLAVTEDAVVRMEDVAAHRRRWLDEQLVEWTAADLAGFVADLTRYNGTLNRGSGAPD